MSTNNTPRYRVPLASITTKIGSGATPRGGKESYKESGISLIRSLNVYDFHFQIEGLALIDEDQAEELSNVEVRPLDILLNITGASVARCCIVPKRILPARVNQHVAIVRVNPIVADPTYVLYCINSPVYKTHLLTLAQGGATREALTKDTIEEYEIPLPPLPIQHRIAAILSAYDDLIENNTRRIKILKEMAQLIYREWFVTFRFPGHEKVTMVDSPLGFIPKNWELKTIADLCESVSYGFTASAARVEVGPKFLRITDIVPDIIDWENVPFCEIPKNKAPRYVLRPGDIVVARTGATTGYAKRLNKCHPESVFASYLVRARAKPGVSDRMLGILMESDEYRKFIKTVGRGIVAVQARALRSRQPHSPAAELRRQGYIYAVLTEG